LCGVGEQELRQHVAKVIRTKATHRGEMPCVSISRQSTTFECLLIPVLNNCGQVEAVAGTSRDITEWKEAEERIARSANYDSLTNLPNRNLFRDRLEHEVKRAERSEMSLALMFIDLDGFKEVNDSLGHAMGDELLYEAARRIYACVREMDTVARLGGDEFTVILADVRKTSHVETLAQHVLEELSKPFRLFENEVQISASVGITLFPQDARRPDDLLKNADQAMYAAKNAGRNQFRFFTVGMRDAARTRVKAINELRLAVQDLQLRVHYQPIIDLVNEQIVKAEAQLRWHHPRNGILRPADFIGLAEETGLIGEIGELVMREALAHAEQWSDLSGAPFQVSVHKSAAEFVTKPCGLAMIASIPNNRILLELDEDVLLRDLPLIREKLNEFCKAGIELAVDNFGVGYASMVYLKKYDINYLKIDQSFVHGVTNNTERRLFAEGIIVMAHKLGLRVIAEGVETAGQKDWLKTAGCDYAQGYYFSPPLPPEQFEHLLR
jgi:diguanylate cyclase (GGDEF)-like protein